MGVGFALPNYFEGLALGVVIDAGEANDCLLAGDRGRDDFVDEVAALPDEDDGGGVRQL